MTGRGSEVTDAFARARNARTHTTRARIPTYTYAHGRHARAGIALVGGLLSLGSEKTVLGVGSDGRVYARKLVRDDESERRWTGTAVK